MKNDNYKYFELQFTNVADDNQLLKHTIDLEHFARLFSMRLFRIDDGHNDSFLLHLPDDDYMACQMMNVIDAYCNLHKIAHRAVADPVDS